MSAELPAPYRLRPFTPDDYPAVVLLGTIAFGDDIPMNVERLRWFDENGDQTRPRGRILAVREDDGLAIGVAAWGQVEQTPQFSCWMVVRPEHRGRGIGSALYAAVLEAIAPYDPPSLLTSARDDQLETLAFLQKRGFVEEMRHWSSRLQMADFRPEPFAEIEENLCAQGIVIRTFAEIDTEPGARQRIYEMHNTLWQDVPSSVTHVPIPFEQWERRNFEDPHFLPEAYFLAVDSATGALAGMSTLSRLPESDHLQTGLTGVCREYRRRGIALALKVRAARYAQAVGAPVIRTGNATTNTGMLAVNELLGYQRQPGRILFGRPLRPKPSPPRKPSRTRPYLANP